jgi:hypothetical protein
MMRVYTPAGIVAHLIHDWDSPNKLGSEALCGRSAWPSLWHGSGTQDEEERAMDLRLCANCQQASIDYRNGLIER